MVSCDPEGKMNKQMLAIRNDDTFSCVPYWVCELGSGVTVLYFILGIFECYVVPVFGGGGGNTNTDRLVV